MHKQTELDQSLIKAATDPSHRLQFLKDMVQSNIYIVNYGPPHDLGDNGILQAGEQLHLAPIEINGKEYLPIFSSLYLLQQVVQEEVNYIALNTLEFFKITKGADIFLNPGAEYGKEFTKAEIEAIIDGSIFKPQHTWQAEQDVQVMIGQPSDYPTELVNGLSNFFKTRTEVKKAYVAHFFNPETDEKPHSLVGIKASNNWNEIVAGSGMVVEAVQVPDPPVEFIQIDDNNIELFNGFKPFYRRKIFGII